MKDKPNRLLELKYPVKLVHNDDGYTAIVRGLPGCITVGDTLEDALKMAADAKQVWIEDALRCGEAAPYPPQVHPEDWTV